uniref:Uncharacterized protein n=1 Tax=Megaselia scalaris TaxID=36166 RepID=T1GJH2_MEGSC
MQKSALWFKPFKLCNLRRILVLLSMFVAFQHSTIPCDRPHIFPILLLQAYKARTISVFFGFIFSPQFIAHSLIYLGVNWFLLLTVIGPKPMTTRSSAYVDTVPLSFPNQPYEFFDCLK